MTQGDCYTQDREKALAMGVRDVATELRLIDVADLIAYMRFEQFGNIGNLVGSSTELYFKPGTVRFGHSGDIDLNWGSKPTVKLDMEFHHNEVSAYFRLLLDEHHGAVEMNYIDFKDKPGAPTPDENTQRLISAIADARLVPTADATWDVGHGD